MSTTINKPETVMLNERMTFSVTTTMPNPYKYHWRRNGILIPGAPSASSYVTLPLRKEDLKDKISCTVYGVLGEETSDEVTLEEKETKKEKT